jgi:hypothetical protein
MGERFFALRDWLIVTAKVCHAIGGGGKIILREDRFDSRHRQAPCSDRGASPVRAAQELSSSLQNSMPSTRKSSAYLA